MDYMLNVKSTNIPPGNGQSCQYHSYLKLSQRELDVLYAETGDMPQNIQCY